MRVEGEINVDAPRDAVFNRLSDAPFFASCIDGVQDLTEIDATHYSAVLDTKHRLYALQLQSDRRDDQASSPPETIEAKVEGTPLGVVGRLTATATTRLAEARRRDHHPLCDRRDADRKTR